MLRLLKDIIISDIDSNPFETSRSYRRVDWRVDREAPACERPCFKLDHGINVLDIVAGELQQHHCVCGVADLPKTKGEPETRKAVLHPGETPSACVATPYCGPASQGNARRIFVEVLWSLSQAGMVQATYVGGRSKARKCCKCHFNDTISLCLHKRIIYAPFIFIIKFRRIC